MRLICYTLFTFVFWKTKDSKSNVCQLSVPSIFNLPCKQLLLFPLLIFVFLLDGCKLVPIQNRDLAGAAGYWEQDENTDPRFLHSTIGEKEIIGILYASGNNTLLNGSRVEGSAEMINNSLVSTGSRSSARIEFKEVNGACLIHINEFYIGNAFANTSANCQHNIETTHVDILAAQDTVYHINISKQKIILTVIKGLVRIVLRAGFNQPINVKGGEEATVTADSVTGPHPVEIETLRERTRWRNNYEFFRSEADWTKIGLGVVAVGGAIAAGLILSDGKHKKGGGGGSSDGSADSTPLGKTVDSDPSVDTSDPADPTPPASDKEDPAPADPPPPPPPLPPPPDGSDPKGSSTKYSPFNFLHMLLPQPRSTYPH